MIRLQRFLAAAFLSLPLFVQETHASQKSSAKAAAPAKVTSPELTAAEYRDLIVNTADGMSYLGSYGQVTAGTGSENVDGRQVPCIITFTYTESAARNVAARRKVWASARVPKALAPSHAEILKWMDSAKASAKVAPKCFLPMMQSSFAQLGFLSVLGGYEDLRKNATTALAGMDVSLPPIAKQTEDNAPRHSDQAVRTQSTAAESQNRTVSQDPPDLNGLLALLAGEATPSRSSALRTVCKGTATPPGAIPLLIAIMNSGDPYRTNDDPTQARLCLLETRDTRVVGPIIALLAPNDTVYDLAGDWLYEMTGQRFKTGREWQQWWKQQGSPHQ
jgi:hypothetical protein